MSATAEHDGPVEGADPIVNVLDPAFYVDPFDSYRWLRDEAPVYWDPAQRLWAISRHHDVVAIERDGATYSSWYGSRPHIDLRGETSMINTDDPQHHRQRNVVARRFTPRAVRDHEAHIRGVVSEVLDPLAERGECDAVEAIASRIPAMVIGDLLGYPRELWERVREWSTQVMVLSGQTSPDGPPWEPPAELIPVVLEFLEVTTELVHARRSEPRDDLLSLWATTEGWTDQNVLDETLLVLDGGAETTRAVIGSMVRELALQPDQRLILLDRPDALAATAVDEFIRWVTPVSNMRRTATVDHELHGLTVREGDQLLLLYGAANRDPRAFDDPDSLDVSRSHNRHVAFGFGSHFCLGAHLARLEIATTFEELFRRMPDWHLVDPEEPRIVPGTFARAYDRITIRYEPS